MAAARDWTPAHRLAAVPLTARDLWIDAVCADYIGALDAGCCRVLAIGLPDLTDALVDLDLAVAAERPSVLAGG